MTDHQDREQDQAQAPAEDLGGAEVQEAQDDAGIAGEPQPTDIEPEDDQGEE